MLRLASLCGSLCGSLGLFAGSCGSVGPEQRGDAATPPPATALLTLPAGTVLRVLPVQVLGAGERDDSIFLSGLWREAMRISNHFDVASGVEDVETQAQVAAQLDPESNTLTSTWVGPGAPPMALASAPFVRTRAGDSIASLAIATRAALGDGNGLLPTRTIYSEVKACVIATETALAAAAADDLPMARGQLADARRADGGCTITLLAAAELELRGSDFARAARIAQEGLGFDARCSPTTKHRLARVLILARAAAASGTDALDLDRQLLALGDAALRERPHDPHGAWTRAQALSMLARYTEAEPILLQLRQRWPLVAQVPYHHGLALLGCERAEPALAALNEAEGRLSPVQTAIPRAIALWSAHRTEELTRFLAELAARDDVQTSGLLHHIRRMQASQAILESRATAAATILLTDLEWIRQRPARIGQFAEHLASTGQVLVLLGHGHEVTRAVDAFWQLPRVDEAARRALTFAGGLAAVASTKDAATTAEASLSKEGASAWSHTLRAAAHRARGELADETRELLAAAKLDRSPLLRASLARALRTAGDSVHAEQLLTALRSELLRLDLRRLAAHPLVDPAHALALLATD